MKMNWSESHIEQTIDHLAFNGDLVLVGGKSSIIDAVESLPFDPKEMDSWCDQWLTESGRSWIYNLKFSG